MKRLKNSRGESLTETLVAVLVIALALILLVNMLTSAKRLIIKSTDSFHSNSTIKNSVEYGGKYSNDSENTEEGTDLSGKVTYSGGCLAGGSDFNLNTNINDSDINDSYVLLKQYNDVIATYTVK